MAPKTVAGADDDTAVREERKVVILRLPSTRLTTRKTATESAASDDDESTVSLEKLKITSSTITAARDAVLNTPELLEAILSFLPVGTILCRCQRVCKNWKKAIATSPTIQTKLWFKSEASEPISPDLLSADHPFLASPWTKESETYRRCMNQNSPCYNGDVACNTLFIGESGGAFRLDRLPSRLRLQAPIAGSPTHHGCYINEVERFLGREHTWLDMFLTEPPVTTARLTLDLPARRFERGDSLYFNHNIANELVHDARGLTFRTIMRRANEVFQFGHWRTPRLIFGRPLKAFVVVHLFAGT